MKIKLVITFVLLFIQANVQSQNLKLLKKQTIYEGKNLEENSSNFSKLNRSTNTVIWGVGGVGAANGEFSLPFINATSYSPEDNTESWTALSVYDTNTITPGNAFWEQSMLGYSQGAYNSGIVPINSPSNTNGVAIFDSDFLDNGGVVGAFGLGQSPAKHKGELISPQIDLTGYTDVPISVEFFSWYRDFTIDELSVSFSPDDGVTWITKDYKELNTDSTQEFVTVNFFNATAGVLNLSKCRFKFTFDGNYYFAIVDDFRVLQGIEYDLGIAAMDPSSGNNHPQKIGDQIHLTSSRYFPLSQLTSDSIHLSVGGNIVNYGYGTVALSLNPRLIVNIELDVSGVWQSVYSTTIISNNVVNPIENATTSDATNVSTVLTDLSWLDVGDFRVTYTAVHDGPDNDNTNNTASHFFTLTHNDYASMVGKDLNGNPIATDSTFPLPVNGNQYISSWEYGSIFYFNDATANNLTVSAVNFTYYLPTNFSGSSDITMNAKIYSISNYDDFYIGNLTLVGSGSVLLTGLGTTIPLGSYQSASVSNFLDPSNNTMSALDDGHYFISIETPLDNTNLGTQAQEVPWMGYSTLKNYNLNRVTYTNNEFSAPGAVITRYDNGYRDYNIVGFGYDKASAIGVEFLSSTLSNESIESIGGIKIYPNPTKDNVSIEFDAINKLLNVEIYEVAGRLINTLTYENQKLISVKLPKSQGVYFIKITNDKDLTITKRVIVE